MSKNSTYQQDPSPTKNSVVEPAKISAVMRFVFMGLSRIGGGQLTVELPDGACFVFGDTHSKLKANIVIKRQAAFSRIVRGGAIGFAEAYMDGDFETDNLSYLLTLLSANLERIQDIINSYVWMRILNRLVHVLRPNTRNGAKKNIYAHYDLGNTFYEKWLDQTMTYSSARFTSPDQDLSAAQTSKYEAIERIADIKDDHHVLEIGCGWGGFAEHAAGSIGCDVTGLTISPSQLAYAQKRLEMRGLNNKAQLRFQDYRDVKEQFDRVVSIEMFEAVGEKYWPTYFRKVYDVLKPGGKAGLQIITIKDENFLRYSKRVDFIQKYIFPGGMLPSPSKLREQFSLSGLNEYAYESFGLDYAKTLAIWRERFLGVWHEIEADGFDEKFKNMWSYYLAYCEAGFRTGAIDVVQIGLEKPA